MGSLVSHTPDTMHLMILVSLAAAASAAPQIVPYEHVEIAAEPYVHQEIPAEPYVHEEPELTPEALGVIDRSKPRCRSSSCSTAVCCSSSTIVCPTTAICCPTAVHSTTAVVCPATAVCCPSARRVDWNLPEQSRRRCSL